MNRRGFITALAALVPASLLPAPKPEPMREWTAVRSPSIMVCHPDHEEAVKGILAEQAEAAGRSYNFLKSQGASKIMARVDRDFLNRKL